MTHRHILLNGYGAAITLRGIVLSLWNGRNWPADLSRVGGLDEQHFSIAVELLTWYRLHGENDPDFMDTGRACEALALPLVLPHRQHHLLLPWMDIYFSSNCAENPTINDFSPKWKAVSAVVLV